MNCVLRKETCTVEFSLNFIEIIIFVDDELIQTLEIMMNKK